MQVGLSMDSPPLFPHEAYLLLVGSLLHRDKYTK